MDIEYKSRKAFYYAVELKSCNNKNVIIHIDIHNDMISMMILGKVEYNIRTRICYHRTCSSDTVLYTKDFKSSCIEDFVEDFNEYILRISNVFIDELKDCDLKQLSEEILKNTKEV